MSDPRHPIRLSILALTMIFAVSLSGCGNDDTNSPFVPDPTDQAPPLSPAGVHIQWQMEGKFSLAWNRNAEPDLSGYRVYLYSPNLSDGNPYSCLTGEDPWTKTNLTIAGSPGTSYFLRVTAVDASGNESTMSDQVTYVCSAGVGQLPTGESGNGDPSGGSGSSDHGTSHGPPAEQGGGGYGQ
jgi:hypothetical protein